MTSRQAGLLLLALCLSLCKAANDGMNDDDDNVQIDPLNKLVLNPGVTGGVVVALAVITVLLAIVVYLPYPRVRREN
ncbi:hypothetical protein GBAR_LOCUS11220 [Geodia barretti]|uniref:Uncharacterized protein n=1 Tax=Geodia barretti TaxID=519541 RepID=A0AA35RWE9_GEOBA|nr:hypothetical protein GBAR_LOCUS11220 [Geodia barretti]